MIKTLHFDKDTQTALRVLGDLLLKVDWSGQFEVVNSIGKTIFKNNIKAEAERYMLKSFYEDIDNSNRKMLGYKG